MYVISHMMIEHHHHSNYSTKQYVTKQQYLVYKEKKDMHLQHINSDILSEPSTGFLTLLQYIPDRLAFCRTFHTALSRTHRMRSTMALQPGPCILSRIKLGSRRAVDINHHQV